MLPYKSTLCTWDILVQLLVIESFPLLIVSFFNRCNAQCISIVHPTRFFSYMCSSISHVKTLWYLCTISHQFDSKCNHLCETLHGHTCSPITSTEFTQLNALHVIGHDHEALIAPPFVTFWLPVQNAVHYELARFPLVKPYASKLGKLVPYSLAILLLWETQLINITKDVTINN